jgi:hypothetical protein
MASIKIATGIKSYDIEDQYGNVRGQISFNPSDLNFINRLADMENKINKYMSEYEKKRSLTVSDESVASDSDSGLEALDEISFYDAQIKRVIDETFDDNVSEIIFGKESCFNMYRGKTFVERFIESILPVIEKDTDVALKSMEKHVSKYTSQKHEA